MNHSKKTNKTPDAMHVMVIDDDVFTVELLKDMLSDAGVGRVSTAPDGQSGIAAIERNASMIDIVICDLNMPGKDGFELMEALAKEKFCGGVLLMSGLGERMVNSAALMGRFHQLCILGALQKPISKAALTDAIWKLRDAA